MIREQINILHLEDNFIDAELIQNKIMNGGIDFKITIVKDRESYCEQINGKKYNLILSDYSSSSFSGLDALTLAKNILPDVPFIFCSGKIGEEGVVEVLKLGAADYVLKARLSRLCPAIERALNEAKEKSEKKRTEESNKLKTEFLAQVSHEIRTPLSVIMSFASMLGTELKETMTDDLKEILNGMDNAGKRLIRTIELILDMSCIQTGRYDPVYRNINITSLIRGLVNEFSSIASYKKLEVEYSFETDATSVYGDEYSVQHMLQNLISNAIKYTETGKVLIRFYKNEKDKMCIDVKDTGIGISKEYFPNLFKPFTQEYTGYSRKYEGTGLGLALTKKYAEINKTDIKVVSQKGVGTTFTLVFPQQLIEETVR